MDDLIKRLRSVDVSWSHEGELCAWAADRIQKLEAALREKDNIAYIIDSHGMTHESFTIVYRAALGEKDDD